MDNLEIDKNSLPEFWNLNDNISAYEGNKIFEIISSGTWFTEDQATLDIGVIKVKKQNVTYEEIFESKLTSPMNFIDDTNWRIWNEIFDTALADLIRLS